MKDKFLSRLDKIHFNIFKLVTFFTYYILTKNRCKKRVRLSSMEIKKINEFWKNYKIHFPFPIHEYEWYKMHDVELNPAIIPDTIWHTYIEPYFNSYLMEKGFEDKNYLDMIINKNNAPLTILRCIDYELLDRNYVYISNDDALKIINKYNELICKPSLESGGGRGISFITNKSNLDLFELIKQYHGNFVVQDMVEQHTFFSRFNSSSLNTLRIVTLIKDGKFYYLSGFLRVGAEGERLDNVSAGGSFIPVNKQGKLSEVVWIENLKNHDLEQIRLDSFKHFDDLNVPYWDEIMKLLEETAFKLSHFKIINWDVSVDKNGVPIIIEYNLMDSSPYFHQLNVGPIFGDLTEEILNNIFKI